MSDNIYCCDVCNKTFKSLNSLSGHQSSHTEKSNKIRLDKENKIKDYLLNPNHCLNCQKPIPYKNRRNKFCNSSCGAQYNNKNRPPRSEESRQKTGTSVKTYIEQNYCPKTNIQFCQCEICNKQFIWNDVTKGSLRFCSLECKNKFKFPNGKNKKIRQSCPKILKTNIEFCQCEICEIKFVWNNITMGSKRFCSKECSFTNASKKASDRLKNTETRGNYGRGKKSYMEQSFEQWLNSYSIIFDTEVKFYNYELNKNYFVDFYFPFLNLVIELDGTQHLKTIEKDKIRDEYLTRVLNLNVIRISHKEYIKKIKYNEICSLLNIDDNFICEKITPSEKPKLEITIIKPKRKQSAEHIRKRAEILRNRKNLDKPPVSAETRKKQSDAKKGKRHSEERKLQNSESHKGYKVLNNGIKNKNVKLENIPEHLDLGWTFGKIKIVSL